jgi:hypothetical protein
MAARDDRVTCAIITSMRRTAPVAFLALSAVSACSSSSSHSTPGDGGASDGSIDTGNSNDTGTTSDTGSVDGPSSGDAPSVEGGGSCPTTNTVTGTVGNQTLAPGGAMAALGLSDASYPNQATIVIANVSGVCALTQMLAVNPSHQTANLVYLSLTLGATSSAAGPVTPGTYTPTTMVNQLTATFGSTDATCQTAAQEETAGQVVLCSAGATFAGTFDLTFGADHVTGTFAAPFCNIDIDGGVPDDGGTTCSP